MTQPIPPEFAVVEVVYLTTLQATLPDASADELTAIALHWAGLEGRVADTARHLIDEEFEARQVAGRPSTLELAR